MSLDPTAQNGFNTAMLQIDVKIIHAFSGSLFLTSDAAGRLHFWDIENPQIKIELQNSEQVRMTGGLECLWIIIYNVFMLFFCQGIIDVILDTTFALILRLRTLELFALPSLCPPLVARNIILNPVSSFQWLWRIDNVSMTTRLHQSKKNPDAYDSVGILVRFGSLFPWVSKFVIIKKRIVFLIY